jgi:hypothetical protein
MQCPACGSDGVAEDVVFCPHCRYQFRQPEEDRVYENQPAPVSYVHTGVSDQKFTKKELQLAKIQLLQPFILLTIAVAGAFYLSSPQIGQMSITLSNREIFYGSILSLISGAVVAAIFYLVITFRLGRS